jgi:hypothetical protein
VRQLGVTSAEPSSEDVWVDDPALNLFSDDNRSAVEAVLSRPGAVVFGWHHHFAGGSSRTGVVFTRYREYVAFVDQAKPGDHLTLFDPDSLTSLAFLRSGAVDSTDSPQLTGADWELLDQRVQSGHEIALVHRRSVAPPSSIEVDLIEASVPEDEWLAELQQQMSTARGELLGWDQAILDAGLVGTVGTVSPKPGDHRVHALVDAKRPNSSGKVPLSGPY